MAQGYDPRITPVREDLVAKHLAARLPRPRAAEGQARQVCAAVLPLRFTPAAEARLETELLFGERFAVYEETGGWAWGQAEIDGYVGYVPAAGLTAALAEPGHVLAAPASHLYPAPDLKRPPLARLSLGSRISVVGEAAGFAEIAGGGWLYARHLASLDRPEPDYVATARRFLGVPYLWGGRSALGLDCSSLLQLALGRAGIAAPRDSDQQAAALGQAVAALEPDGFRHGDLVYFPGHAGIVVEGGRFLHANAFAMAVTLEPLADVLDRAEAAGAPPSALRRLWRDGRPPAQ